MLKEQNKLSFNDLILKTNIEKLNLTEKGILSKISKLEIVKINNNPFIIYEQEKIEKNNQIKKLANKFLNHKSYLDGGRDNIQIFLFSIMLVQIITYMMFGGLEKIILFIISALIFIKIVLNKRNIRNECFSEKNMEIFYSICLDKERIFHRYKTGLTMLDENIKFLINDHYKIGKDIIENAQMIKDIDNEIYDFLEDNLEKIILINKVVGCK